MYVTVQGEAGETSMGIILQELVPNMILWDGDGFFLGQQRLGRETQESACLYFLISGIIGASHHAWLLFLCRCWKLNSGPHI